MELAGQAAIVTGAGRGIGRATALELARLGADIVIAELDRANAERTAARVHDRAGYQRHRRPDHALSQPAPPYGMITILIGSSTRSRMTRNASAISSSGNSWVTNSAPCNRPWAASETARLTLLPPSPRVV